MAPTIPHADPGVPDTRGPLRYIWWLVRRQTGRVLLGSVVSTAWMTGTAVRPYLVARAIDDGLRTGDRGALLVWVGAIVVAGVVLAYLGISRHRTMTFIREDATARSAEVLSRHLSTVGGVLSRKIAAGEVATVGGSDISHVSQTLTVTGPGVGAVLAYVAVAFVLWSVSPMLALFVLLGVPLLVGSVGPLLRGLERVESDYRRRQGALTARANDIVAGLRVLAGVGGRGLFHDRYAERSRLLVAEGYRVGRVMAWIIAMTIAIPGLYLAAVVWLAARMTAAGEITVGEMVAVYGYVAILVVPVWFLLECSYQVIRGRVAARRIIALLAITPDPVAPTPSDPGPVAPTPSDPDPVAPTPSDPGPVAPDPDGEPTVVPDRPADLHDPATGLTVRHGRLVAVAATDPAEAVDLADRLGRYLPGDVTWGGARLTGMPLPEVRRRILHAEHDSYLFAGALRDILAVRDGIDPAAMTAALRTASAGDIVDALPDGLDTRIDARARNLSGGQRQRIRLARALLAEAEVLILVEPTSAVDAHTESRIARRLRRARAGRTTVVLTTSPLLLGYADTVAFLRDGRIVAEGTHLELLAVQPAYRSLVSRTGAAADDDRAATVERAAR